MPQLDPEYLTFNYRCQYRGVPGPDHDPGDYPMEWTVSVSADVWDDDDDGGDGEEVHVGDAQFTLVPDAGDIHLFLTLDAVSQELANIGEMLTTERPDLLEIVGPDLLYLSSLRIEPQFRGHDTGHAILTAILATVGRAVGMVVLEPAPVLRDEEGKRVEGVPLEGTPEHAAVQNSLRRYWMDFGFTEATSKYLVLDTTWKYGSQR
jgi:GNAT superfamily N-acetyltransferase